MLLWKYDDIHHYRMSDDYICSDATEFAAVSDLQLELLLLLLSVFV